MKYSVKLRTKKLKKGRESYFLAININGKREYEYLNLYHDKANDKVDPEINRQTKLLAKTIQAQRVLDLKSGEHGFVPAHKKKTLFLEYYKAKMQEFQNKEATHRSFLYTLKSLEKFGIQNIKIVDITEKWCSDYKQWLLNNHAQNTASEFFSRLRQIMRFAYKKDNLIQISPMDNLKNIPKDESDREYLTTEELQALANTECKYPELKRAFLFSCFTGLRKSDLERVKYENIKNGNLHITTKKTKTPIVVKLNPVALSIAFKDLEGIPSQNQNLFKFPSDSTSLLHLKQWAKKAGITKNIFTHIGRHTAATQLLLGGADIYTVMKILGLKNLKTVQVYAKVADSLKDRAIDNLPNIAIG